MKSKFFVFSFLFFIAAGIQPAASLDLDWSGQFRGESAWFPNYTADSDGSPFRDATREAANGYYIPAAGSKKANFQTVFLRLTPKVIVNDNVTLKTELWLGNPITGFYGSAYPGSTRTDQRFFNSNFSQGSSVTAQRFWGEFTSDFGVLVVGRAPLHWGLGLVHHSGDAIFDRYQTTGDVIKLNAKFGNFSFIPSTTKYDFGNAVGGVFSTAAPTSRAGGMGLSEYSIALKYENAEEDMEGGVNFVRRIAGAQNQTPWINGQSGGMAHSIWDIYGKKKAGKFKIGFEAPIFSGNIVGIPYKAFALAGEVEYQASEAWSFNVKGGKVPGQPNSGNATTTKWNMVYFHPNYRLGLIMFNYQLRRFAGPNNVNPQGTTAPSTVESIYDNPITNANYINVGGAYTTDKWRFGLNFITASADETAQSGRFFFNTWNRAYHSSAATKNQGTGLGSEIDLDIAMQWDEMTHFGLGMGYFMPGSFYAFSNSTADNKTNAVFATVFRVGVQF